MPIEIFLFFETSQKKKKRSLRVVVFFPRKGKGVREKTHRHFDASGRLPADFHVEEHDWVGHDDDWFKEKIMRFFCDDFDGRFPSQNRKSAPTKKHTRENKHTQKMHKKSLSPTSKSPLSKVIKKKGQNAHFMRSSIINASKCCWMLLLARSASLLGDHMRSTLSFTQWDNASGTIPFFLA